MKPPIATPAGLRARAQNFRSRATMDAYAALMAAADAIETLKAKHLADTEHLRGRIDELERLVNRGAEDDGERQEPYDD